MAHLKLEAPKLLSAEGNVGAWRCPVVESVDLAAHQLIDGVVATDR
jgi:hypothetical protein